ncbi:MAG TPA: biopolymer transporter ExbD [Azoarcus taiwanensis]|uniref:Biopolymer transporter ExbD n=1 Tax=Azoarcus taiwanensis TaxID=666964 RepID=A0A972J9X4_9RHOO|nr:biopolymer transporter ExbD [Azoarcus taiwanensis]NMG02453.1 biopolymer transporter ExbD [Azoarcus taiwanensis]HRQ57521.1 biopolymer transporter ExbD [Azoarcus taiwanensis]
MNFQRGSRQEPPEVNLIPLIDVVLVIIIFLMLTTTFSKVSGLEINLPTADAEATEALPNEITVAVTAAGEVIIEGRPVGSANIDEIAVALGRAVRPEASGAPVIVINADARAAHQSVIDVMQAAQRAGLPNITFAIQAPDS